MIRYTVVWHDEAQAQLAQMWIEELDRNSLVEATHIIDVELGFDAESKGASVEGGLQELVVPPLRILFAVSEPDRLVKVLHVTQW